MRDDTRGDEASLAGFQISTSIDEILQHRNKRPLAARWARNLRFLTYAGDENDIDVQMPEGLDSSKEQGLGQCTRCELRVPPAAGHICAAHASLEKSDIKTYERKARDYGNPCIHVENASCGECMQIPLFPTRCRATKFRIRRVKPNDKRPCTHYMAVSYCWSSAQRSGESNAGSETYTVLEEDMTTERRIRAPMDVIDRAVNFAAENGIRMIWIDQECIEQDNEVEKEQGIQAMDFVYTNAHISIGLFRATLEPRHLQALLLFFESKVGSGIQRRDIPRRRPRPPKYSQRLLTKTLAEALSVVAMDKWNTRAWILQEAFVSAGNMTILFPKAKDMAIEGWDLVCQDLSLTEIAINLHLLQKCIDRCAGFFNPKPGSSIPVKLPHWAEILERLKSFLPEVQFTHMFSFWIGGSKNRRTCNAAVAWSFLKHRDNDRVADKLAILANLCDYTLRLDTVELEKSQKPLSVCIFALALANGDLSLLSPDSYHMPRGVHNTQHANDGDFTWVPPDFRQLRYIKAKSADPGGPNFGQDSPVRFQVTSKGLLLPGFLWRIDHFVGLPTIQDKYAAAWSRLWRWKEATENPDKFYEMSRSHWLAITHILFEVILLLRKEDQISVADAIWHSVMNAHWRKLNLFESDSDFPEQLTVGRRKGMFRLDQGPNGSFEQKWLVDRIMLQGGFWVGRLVRRSEDDEYRDTKLVEDGKNEITRLKEEFIQHHAELNAETSRAASASQADSVAITPAHQSPSTSAKRSSVWDPRSPRTPSLYQGSLFFLREVLNQVSMTRNNNSDPFSNTMAPLASFADYLAAIDNMDTKNSLATLQQQRAVFDIQGSPSGQVLALTPFQKRLETLPRPLTRSTRVSWVVQADGSDSGGSEGGIESDSSESEGGTWFNEPDGEEVLRTEGMVRGMWKTMVEPLNRYRVV